MEPTWRRNTHDENGVYRGDDAFGPLRSKTLSGFILHMLHPVKFMTLDEVVEAVDRSIDQNGDEAFPHMSPEAIREALDDLVLAWMAILQPKSCPTPSKP